MQLFGKKPVLKNEVKEGLDAGGGTTAKVDPVSDEVKTAAAGAETGQSTTEVKTDPPGEKTNIA